MAPDILILFSLGVARGLEDPSMKSIRSEIGSPRDRTNCAAVSDD